MFGRHANTVVDQNVPATFPHPATGEKQSLNANVWLVLYNLPKSHPLNRVEWCRSSVLPASAAVWEARVKLNALLDPLAPDTIGARKELITRAIRVLLDAAAAHFSDAKVLYYDCHEMLNDPKDTTVVRLAVTTSTPDFEVFRKTDDGWVKEVQK